MCLFACLRVCVSLSPCGCFCVAPPLGLIKGPVIQPTLTPHWDHSTPQRTRQQDALTSQYGTLPPNQYIHSHFRGVSACHSNKSPTTQVLSHNDASIWWCSTVTKVKHVLSARSPRGGRGSVTKQTAAARCNWHRIRFSNCATRGHDWIWQVGRYQKIGWWQHRQAQSIVIHWQFAKHTLCCSLHNKNHLFYPSSLFYSIYWKTYCFKFAMNYATDNNGFLFSVIVNKIFKRNSIANKVYYWQFFIYIIYHKCLKTTCGENQVFNVVYMFMWCF